MGFFFSNLFRQALWVGDIIYDSNWCSQERDVQKCVQFVVGQAQKRIYITGGGITNIDRHNFTLVNTLIDTNRFWAAKT